MPHRAEGWCVLVLSAACCCFEGTCIGQQGGELQLWAHECAPIARSVIVHIKHVCQEVLVLLNAAECQVSLFVWPAFAGSAMADTSSTMLQDNLRSGSMQGQFSVIFSVADDDIMSMHPPTPVVVCSRPHGMMGLFLGFFLRSETARVSLQAMGARVHTISHTYFISKANLAFEGSVIEAPGGPASMWFDLAGHTVLDAHLPLGVIVDALLPATHEGPIPITVHFSKLPEPGVRFLSAAIASCQSSFFKHFLVQAAAATNLDQSREQFMNTLKQAIFLRCGDMRPYTDLPQARLDAFWTGVEALNWEAAHWRAVMPDTVEGIASCSTETKAGASLSEATAGPGQQGESEAAPATSPPPCSPFEGGGQAPEACSSVPIRLLECGSTVFHQAQLILPPPEEAGGGSTWTARHSRGVVAASSRSSLQQAVTLVGAARDIPDLAQDAQGAAVDGGVGGVQFMIHGVCIPPAAPVGELYETMAHPDGFLYVVAKHRSE